MYGVWEEGVKYLRCEKEPSENGDYFEGLLKDGQKWRGEGK